ncbi:MAG: hypothetical protein KatS3mg077_2248 [Candidatus Binatia bacterium]|nr:MAG: hypothetical protein KatS3mg077_2248 [Candidatus Binatia bacterium]
MWNMRNPDLVSDTCETSPDDGKSPQHLFQWPRNVRSAGLEVRWLRQER